MGDLTKTERKALARLLKKVRTKGLAVLTEEQRAEFITLRRKRNAYT